MELNQEVIEKILFEEQDTAKAMLEEMFPGEDVQIDVEDNGNTSIRVGETTVYITTD